MLRANGQKAGGESSLAPTSFVPDLPFDRIIADGMISMIRDLLGRIAAIQGSRPAEASDVAESIERSKAVEITLRVDRPDVVLPLFLRKLVNEKRSLRLTIVLDNFFRSLAVGQDGFSVTLSFTREHGGGQVWAPVTVPYSAIAMIRIGENCLTFIPFLPDDIAEQSRSGRSTAKVSGAAEASKR